MAALFTTGRYEMALEVADIAAHWFRRNGDSMGLAKVEVNTGNLWYRREQHQKALQHHARARELFEYLGEKYALAMTYLNMGNCYSCTRQLSEAARSYDMAEELSEQLGMKELTMQIRYNRAYLKFLQQQYGESIAAFGVVREYFVSTSSDRHVSLCDLDCAEIYLHLLNFPEAAKLARRAAAGFEKLAMSYEHAKALGFLGMALLKSKEFSEGEAVVGQSRELFEREGNERWVSVLDANLTQFKMQRAAPASHAPTGLRSEETTAASVESLLTLIKNTRR
jgi:tetratricopeptide (TPR) repeat protein